MTNDEFGDIVDEAVASIPKEFLQKLENVAIVVEDVPTPHQIRKLRSRGVYGFLLGLYEGVPQTKRHHYGVGGHLPDKITIFKKAILAIARSRYHLEEIIKNTVVHEIAHHFGMGEMQIRDAEMQRRKRQN